MSEIGIREYREADWPMVRQVHDSARKIELALAVPWPGTAWNSFRVLER